MPEKTCFIAMPLTTTQEARALHNDDADHFVHVLEHLFVPAVEAAGFTPIRPIMSGADVIQGQIIKYLETADMVLCDISGHNPNVFFELGIRTALDRPVALVRDDKTTKLPFDTSIVNTHTYRSALAPWTLAEDLKDLSAHLSHTQVNSPDNNALWGFFGLTKRASERLPSENPLEAKVDLLVGQVARLSEGSGWEGATDEESILIDRILALASRFKVTILSYLTEPGRVTLETDTLPPREFVNKVEAYGKSERKEVKVLARNMP